MSDPEPVVATFGWYGAYACVPGGSLGPPLGGEDEREMALLDVLLRQFREWGPERSHRLMRALSDRMPGSNPY